MVSARYLGAGAALCALASIAVADSSHCGTANPVQKENSQMSQDLPRRGGSRLPPPKVDPVVLNGVRYEQARSGIPLDADDPSGWMRATDVKTSNEVWLMQIYKRPPGGDDDSLPAGGRPVVYMKSIVVRDGNLVVTDMLGRSFVVDPATGASRPAD